MILTMTQDKKRHRPRNSMHGIRIDAGDWMKRKDMIEFMESAAGWTHVGEGNKSWGPKEPWREQLEKYGDDTPDFADRFMWVEQRLFNQDPNDHSRSGSDWELLPEDVAIEISKILDAEGFQYGIVWLKPFDPNI